MCDRRYDCRDRSDEEQCGQYNFLKKNKSNVLYCQVSLVFHIIFHMNKFSDIFFFVAVIYLILLIRLIFKILMRIYDWCMANDGGYLIISFSNR